MDRIRTEPQGRRRDHQLKKEERAPLVNGKVRARPRDVKNKGLFSALGSKRAQAQGHREERESSRTRV